MIYPITEHTVENERHRTFYLAGGAPDAPLIVFVHGWPELSISWRHQLPVLRRARLPRHRARHARLRPLRACTRATRTTRWSTIVRDMLELLDALGRDKAVWVGHDWGSPVVWSMASHHPDALRRRGEPLRALSRDGLRAARPCVPLVDRTVYPEARVSGRAVGLPALLRGELRQGARGLRGQLAQHREGAVPQGRSRAARASRRAPRSCAANGGWFGGAGQAPDLPRDADVLTEEDLEAYAAALTRNGFFGPGLLVHEPRAQRRLRRSARRTAASSTMPVLFLHGAYDYTCETVDSRLAEPMRRDCAEPHRGGRAVRPLDGAGEARRGERRPREMAGGPVSRVVARVRCAT